MSGSIRLGLFGGTFDPIHVGHLDAAAAARAALALDEVLFVPSHVPPHRATDPHATPFHRFAMVALATAGETAYRASDIELGRSGASYTYETLAALHAAGWRPAQLFFIIGADAFAEIASWHRYPAVLDAAHFAVVTRPGTTLDQLRSRLPALRDRMTTPAAAVTAVAPQIILIEGETPDVSSTEIRRLAARGDSVSGMVTPSVAAYIAQHSLYQH